MGLSLLLFWKLLLGWMVAVASYYTVKGGFEWIFGKSAAAPAAKGK